MLCANVMQKTIVPHDGVLAQTASTSLFFVANAHQFPFINFALHIITRGFLQHALRRHSRNADRLGRGSKSKLIVSVYSSNSH